MSHEIIQSLCIGNELTTFEQPLFTNKCVWIYHTAVRSFAKMPSESFCRTYPQALPRKGHFVMLDKFLITFGFIVIATARRIPHASNKQLANAKCAPSLKKILTAIIRINH